MISMTLSFSILGILAIPLVLFAIMVGVYTFIAKKYASVPFELLNAMTDVPLEHKERAAECFKEVARLDRSVMWYDLSAPFVVPFILLFTKRDAERLAFLDHIYGNNVEFMRNDGVLVGGINGDNFGQWELTPEGSSQPKRVPLEDSPAVRSMAYWVDGKYHPRSFIARWVWLGFRNRASKASYNLGVDMRPIDHDRESWGDVKTRGRLHEGVVLHRCGDHYQLYSIKFAGENVIRVNVGYKVWQSMHHKDAYIASPVNIVYSKITKK